MSLGVSHVLPSRYARGMAINLTVTNGGIGIQERSDGSCILVVTGTDDFNIAIPISKDDRKPVGNGILGSGIEVASSMPKNKVATR